MLKLSMLQSASALLVAAIIFSLIIVCYLLGYSIRQNKNNKNPGKASAELGAINGTLLGLLGLLLAFTFGMASSRFDTRRQVIISEANNIGTVILRADLYPDSTRKLLKQQLKQYVEARINYYQAGMDETKIAAASGATDSLNQLLWNIVSSHAANEQSSSRTSELMIPALNDMIDITTTRRAAGEATIPDSIMYFLFVLCASSAFLLGYDNKHRIDWIVVMGLAIMLSATVFTIIDLDRPRSGLISMDKPNAKIIELRAMFK